MAEKLRIHQLAKSLNVDSKTILAKCKAESVEVKNHMSTVSAGLAATIQEWFSAASTTTAMETSAKVDLAEAHKKGAIAARRKKAAKAHEVDDGDVAVVEAEVAVAAPPEPPAEEVPIVEPEPIVMEAPPEEPVAEVPEPEEIDEPETPDEEPQDVAPEVEPEAAPPAAANTVVPAGPQNVPQPFQLKGPRVIRVEKPDPLPPYRPPRYRQTGLNNAPAAEAPAAPGSTPAKRGARSKTYQSDAAAKKRRPSRRRGSDAGQAGQQLREWKDSDLAERQQRLRRATGRRAKRRASEGGSSAAPMEITSAQVTEPIILKEFCSATGVSLVQLTPKLMNEFKILPNINMTLEKEMAQELAAAYDIELTVVPARNPLDDIRDEFKNRERPDLKNRPPVVTFLGHVDHGKTSLCDAIRNTRVVKGEAGGITQHMGAYHFERDGLAVTFLDTPGHAAFTAMRARGANLTDVVVLVVAADDGVMPQTVEAINHAKAAAVPIVVALNKVDIPGIDLNKVYGQLAEHELIPTEWGGTVDVIKTSAIEGQGIDDLIEHLSTLSELLELKADPTLAACGRVIEAEMKPGVGPVARVLIQDGTLNKGDFMVCGPGFGKVRTMRDDRSRTMPEAGPAMPVEVSGLDDLPAAGDEFFQVDTIKRAELIATQVKDSLRKNSLSTFNKPKTLEDLFGQTQAGTIPELNVIVKADMRGSVDVLRKSLSEFPSDQVTLQIIHSGVGAISESDVLLAEASGATIVGFQVVPDTHVQRLAEDKSVQIRMYRVIYNLMEDIKAALEGLLEPEKKLERRGSAEVREIFKVSKIGVVAGCFVKDGQFLRSHVVRVIRDGVVVRDEAKLSSLRRFKDDVKEVKNGYECGIKVDGFDDVKPADIIESYEILKIARTL